MCPVDKVLPKKQRLGSQKARTSANSRWCYFRDAEENLFGLKERPEHRAR